jgi:two-component system sensor kinase
MKRGNYPKTVDASRVEKGTEELISELRRSAAWMDMVMSNLAEGVVVVNENFRVIFVNDAFANMLVQTKLFLLSKSLFEVFTLKDISAQNGAAVSKEDFTVSGFRGGTYAFQKNSQKENGLVFIEVGVTYIPPLRQTVLVMHDITERKKAEDEALRVNRELETFSYSISHDLRAPLRTIDGFSKILIEEYAGKLDSEGKRFLANIRNGAQEMGKLIDDILTLSRFGRQAIKAENIDMQPMVSAIAHTLIAAVPSRKIEADIRPMPFAYADPALIRQVWVNLISNAIKFTKTKETAIIVISGEEKDGEVEYSIEDNGAGFDMQYAEKLFGVFQRLHSSEEFEGTGVGLAIVSHIVLRHGGKVRAEGKVNEGARFFFTLPKLPVQ